MKYFEVCCRLDWQQFADFSGNFLLFRTGDFGLRVETVDSCSINKSMPDCKVHIPYGSKLKRQPPENRNLSFSFKNASPCSTSFTVLQFTAINVGSRSSLHIYGPFLSKYRNRPSFSPIKSQAVNILFEFTNNSSASQPEMR